MTGTQTALRARIACRTHVRCVLAAAMLACIPLAGCVDDQPAEEVDEEPAAATAQPEELPPGFARYRNERFGYVLAYPDSLLDPVTGEEAEEASDTQRFVSPDEAVVLTASGRALAPGDSIPLLLEQRIRRFQAGPGLVLHSERDDSSFVVRRTAGDELFYEKTIFYDDVLARIELAYPVGMRSTVDSLTEPLFGSFAGPAADLDRR